MSSTAHTDRDTSTNETNAEQQRRRRRRGRGRQRSPEDSREQSTVDTAPVQDAEGQTGTESSPDGNEATPKDRGRRNRRNRNRNREVAAAATAQERPSNGEPVVEEPAEPPRKPKQQETTAQKAQPERQDKKRDRNKKREKVDIASQPGSLQRRMVRIDGPREELRAEPYIPVIAPVKASTVDEYIANHKGWQRDVMAKLRALIKSTCPEAVESIKWSQPVYEYEGFLCYMKAFNNHVNLGFWRGAELSDPEGLLSGDGLKLRHVSLTSVHDFRADAFTDFIKHAMRLNREKGDPTLS